MKEGSPQLRLIRTMFQFLLEMFNERQRDPLTALPAERMFSTLQFQVDHYCWVFSNNNNQISMEEFSFGGQRGERLVSASCSISTDAATMLKICRGEMSFPNAYLSRKLKLHGDQNVLKSIGVPMKDALDALKSMKMEPEPVLTSLKASPAPASRPEVPKLTAKIVEAFAHNFHYNIEDKFSPKAGQRIGKDIAVRYKIELSHEGSDETWTVSHRYSHFLHLRSELIEQGFRSIPVINAKNSMFNSLERVVQSRIIHLGLFINECIAQVGHKNESLNEFLAKPITHNDHQEGTQTSSPRRDENGPHVTVQLPESDNIGELFGTINDDKCAYQHHREALEHAWGSPITWAKDDLHHSRFLVKELAAQRKTLEALHKSNAQHSSNLIATFLVSLRAWSMVLVCGAISAYFYERTHIEHGLQANLYVEAVVKLTLAVLLFFRSTRYQCLFYCICWLLAINAMVVSVASANDVVNRYTEHWTMYKSHLKWLTIKHSVVMVPEAFRLPPSVTNILKESLPVALHDLTMGGMNTLVAAAKSVFLSPTSLYGVMVRVLEAPVEDQPAMALGLLTQTDPIVCAMIIFSALIVFILRSERLLRVLWIYFLGVSLIATYASLQIACFVFRLSPSISEALFSRFDAVVAPFVVQQIGLLRSVFVKFAQYFGGRSDVVSPVWTELLSQLQDACPASSQEYVRRTVEAQLGSVMSQVQADSISNSGTSVDTAAFKLEDLFEEFDMTPIASASIGQVHTATLKHSALMKILQHQRHTESSRHSSDAKAASDGNAEEGRDSETASDSVSGSGSGPGSRTHSNGDVPPTPIPAPRILSPSTTPVTSNGRTTTTATTTASELRENAWYEPFTDPSFVSYASSEASQLVSVVVKVQHEKIEPMMLADMAIVLVLIKWASFIDSRWVTMLQVMRSWDLTMRGELDYRQEAANLREMRGIMSESGLGAATPQPVPGLESERVLVMTRLFGYKVTDKPALLLNNVDREALLSRIAHCSAYQLLVAGVFNADPHAGNILFCLSTKDQRPSHILDSAAAAAAASSHSHTNTNTNSGASGGLRYSSDRASVASQLSQLSEEGSIAQGGGVCSSTADRFMASDQSGQVSSSADRSSTAPTSTASRNSASSGTPLETAAPGENAGAADEANEERHCTSNVYDRHIYDATPAKGVTFGSQTANSVPSPAAPAVLHSVASAPTQGADCVLPLQRRMIYDATPGKNVGFAAEISPHSAVSYSTQATSTTPGAHPTQQVSQQTPIRAAPAPIAAAAAGHTPYPMSGLTSASSNGARRRLASTSPGSSIGLSTAFRQFGPSPMSASFASLPSESGACPDIIPGLLDFGMTVRLAPERRRTYCRLIIALCDGDLKTAAAELKAVGYSSNQSERAPERDAEFFEHIFRDANPRGVSKQERTEFSNLRAKQKQDDIAAGQREKGGRSIANVPDDFLFLTRLVGLLRGLTSELDCSCPILYILSLNARVGLEREEV